MNLATIPLLIVALLLMSGNPDAETAQLVLAGDHQIEDHQGSLIVGEAELTIPAGAEVTGPIYVIGGQLTVRGAVLGDVVQLAGTVRVEAEGRIADDLQHIAGTLVVSDGAEIGRRTSFDLAAATDDEVGGLIRSMVLTLLLAGAGYLLAKRRTRELDNVAAALTGHPVVTFTVGTLLTLTFLSIFVFMGLTLVLIPVALVGLIVGMLTVGYGVVAWGHVVGRHTPIRHRGLATFVGVVIVLVSVRLAGAIPIVGDVVVAALLLVGIGGVVVTYYGVSRFRPATIPD